MMRKVVYNNYSPSLTTNFGPALHILKTGERAANAFLGQSPCIGGDYYSQAIQKIEFAEQRCFKFMPGLVVTVNFKATQGVAEVGIPYLPPGIGAHAKGLQFCK